MRLWSISPKYLDSRGLVALWREGLLAKRVLEGNTNGYKNHPQLNRFNDMNDPVGLINSYLVEVYEESLSRGYKFDKTKIKLGLVVEEKIVVTSGQIVYEQEHLRRKLEKRSREDLKRLGDDKILEVNSIFRVVKGGIQEWERLGI